MRILFVHNTYQHRGGEDAVVESEIALLRSHGHEVETWFRSNDDVIGMSTPSLARNTLWSSRTHYEVMDRVRQFQPNLIHAHNTFPLISPSLYWAAAHVSVPVVQTLHNFRLMCLNAMLLREGRVCEDCMGHLPWRGVTHACYRGSRLASSALAGMLALHRGIGTYRNKVARYIALNEFCRSKFIEGGLPAERIVVKPNFVDFDKPESTDRLGLLFVGRLSAEKGVATLASAISKLGNAQLRVIGDGPEFDSFSGLESVVQLGRQPGETVRKEMSCARALIVPSIWYENFPRTIVESFACGTPVIASRIGSIACIIEDGRTGLLFDPADAQDLANKMAWALENPENMAEMGRCARQRYEAEFSAEVNYRKLVEIYEDAIRSG
ncbi:glycosyltransferase family 4 protein [Thiohalobacter thiocyanaticus]|uniref:Glycosyltransferase n=1 Tax=Thiohalobacter thiocyanaticus TaxID=585455 RepID=A0A426QIS2_9GAMM|nr:glycosyltransferase family 4 protein [Thiohalobacter thiocyanaticus]RRQ21648.1 glycosyltransferase [Thiohalobacter thiocyanaticus]